MANEPLTGARVPVQGDAALGGLQINNAVSDVAPYTIPHFTNATARDAAFSAWVAAGNTMRKGLLCYQTDTDWHYKYTGSKWLPWGAEIDAQVKQNASHDLFNGQYTPIAFDSEDYDSHNVHTSTAPWRCYAPIDGVYLVSGSVWFAGGAGGGRRIVRYNYQPTATGSPTIALNSVKGAVQVAANTEIGVVADPMMFTIYAGGWIEIQASQDSGATIRTLVNADARSTFLFRLVRAI